MEDCIRFWKVTKARKHTARPEFLQGCPERLFREAVETKLEWKDVRDSCRHRVEPAQRHALQGTKLERQATQALRAQ